VWEEVVSLLWSAAEESGSGLPPQIGTTANKFEAHQYWRSINGQDFVNKTPVTVALPVEMHASSSTASLPFRLFDRFVSSQVDSFFPTQMDKQDTEYVDLPSSASG